MPTRTTAPGTKAALLSLAASEFNSLPGGWLGHETTTTNQTGITVEEDLDDLSVTVTVGADRMLKITAKVPVSSAVASDRVGMSIKEGSTVLGSDQTDAAEVNLPYTLTAHAVIDGPSAGTHTYKLSAGLGGGATGPMRSDHASNGRSFILVEDIGPASS